MDGLCLENLSKRFGDKLAVDDVSLEIPRGSWLVLAGPSGCGKTTLLRLIAGLEVPSAGQVYINQERVTHWPPAKRQVAMAFQQPSLIGHMTVRANWMFAMSSEKVDRGERQRRIEAVAEALDLACLLDRYPRELSGGECQRAALGRLLVRRPLLQLFDEPFNQLDLPLRTRLRRLLLEHPPCQETTTVFVTHDQSEAMTMADRLAIMWEGRLLQVGRPEELYCRPLYRQVAEFLGEPPMNFFQAYLRFSDGRWWLESHGARWLVCDPNSFSVKNPSLLPAAGQPTLVDVGVRPEHCRWCTEPPSLESGQLLTVPGQIRRLWYQGADRYAEIRCESLAVFLVRIPADELPPSDSHGWLVVPLDRLHLFDAQSGNRVN